MMTDIMTDSGCYLCQNTSPVCPLWPRRVTVIDLIYNWISHRGACCARSCLNTARWEREINTSCNYNQVLSLEYCQHATRGHFMHKYLLTLLIYAAMMLIWILRLKRARAYISNIVFYGREEPLLLTSSDQALCLCLAGFLLADTSHSTPLAPPPLLPHSFLSRTVPVICCSGNHWTQS